MEQMQKVQDSFLEGATTTATHTSSETYKASPQCLATLKADPTNLRNDGIKESKVIFMQQSRIVKDDI